jgi:hypothetical protein
MQKLSAALATFFMVGGCAPHNPPPRPSSPVHPMTNVPMTAADKKASDALPSSPDVAGEVMGWLVVSDGARIAQQLSPPGADVQKTQAALLMQIGLAPDVAAVIDLQRPMAIGLLNPSLLAVGNVQPYVAMVPIRSRAAVEKLFTEHQTPIERHPWGLAVPTAKDAKMNVAFRGNSGHEYAVVAWRPDLLGATEKLLAPRLAEKADAPLVVHLDFDNVHEAFGPQVEAMLGQVGRVAAQGGAANDPEVAYALRGVKQIARYMQSVSSLELLANLDSGGLTLTVRAEGKEGSPFHHYVSQQHPGPAWGTQFLPRDSVLAYATHGSAIGRAADVVASAQYFGDADAQHPAGDVERARVRDAFEKAALTTDGELAYAVWPARHGGVGLGGAYRVNNPVAARAAMGELYRTLAPRLGALVMRGLMFDADKLGKHAKVSRSTVKIADVDVDLVEVAIEWPKTARIERHLFEAMFGKSLVLSTAFVGDQALFAVGADWQPRLRAMLDTAKGVPAASLGDEPQFAEALQYKQDSRVSLSYMPTDKMAQFAAMLVAQSGGMNGDQGEMVARVLEQVGNGAIVSTTNAGDGRYELTTHVPHSAIMGVAQLNGALWRMALSPLVNPPMMPPMPVPPPHVAPSVNRTPASPTDGTL